MTLQDDKILEIINMCKNQELPPEAALAQIKGLQYTDLGFANLDNNRGDRQGFPEVIYCAGKTPEQCAEIMYALSLGLLIQYLDVPSRMQIGNILFELEPPEL